MASFLLWTIRRSGFAGVISRCTGQTLFSFDSTGDLCQIDYMKDGLYNKALGLPAGAALLWAGRLELQYANHAQAERNAENYGSAELFSSADFESKDVVEVQVQNGQPVKAVVRFPYSDNLDLCMVINTPASGRAFVRTVWFNAVDDKHHTLNRSLYNRP